MRLTLKILDAQGSTRIEEAGEDELTVVQRLSFLPGDRVQIEADAGAHLLVRLDETVGTALLWLPNGAFAFPVPFGKARAAYAPGAFAGEMRFLQLRSARTGEIATRRDLAFNPLDHAGNDQAFPHVIANVETRGEALFAARNVIDGLTATAGHGEWPFTSWGINRSPDAALTVFFGRAVRIDEVILHTRADFPHDSWWEQATLAFSEGPDVVASLEKTGQGQSIRFPERSTEWLRLDRLIKADDPSPFPALTSIACLGRDA